jgi:hypothetical protein
MSNAFDTTNSPNREPVEIIKGDFAAWRRPDLAGVYDPAIYTLSYEFRSEGTPSKKQSLAATNNSGAFLITLASADSADWIVANYHWSAYITRIADSERVQVDTGIVTVTANKAIDNTDPRSHALQMLAEIERAMLHRATNTQLDTLAYSLGTETSASRDTEKLITWRSYWQRELTQINQRIRARKGQSHSGIIRTRF